MIISRTEIANAVRAYTPWEPKVIPFPSKACRRHHAHTILRARTAYDGLPHLRDTLVLDLQGRIVAGRYYVPANLIVEKLLGRLLIDRIAS